MASLTPEHRRSTRTRREPKRFTDEKFVSGRVDQYTRGYSGWQEDKWLNKYQDAENYFHDHKNRKFGTVNWINSGKYRVNLRDFPESLLEFVSIWRDFNRVLPSAVVSHIGEFLRFSKIDQDLLIDDDEFIAGDESENEGQDNKKWSCSGLPMDEEEWNSSDEDTDESDYDSSDYLCEDDEEEITEYCPGCEGGVDSDCAHRSGHKGTGYHPECYMNSEEENSPKRATFSDKIDEFDTYSSSEYNRTNSDFYDAIRRRDRVDKNWRRIIMRVYAPLL